ncbi:MAG: HDOD domain-containing protein [Desulfobulbaceae bacterium]|nr:HDOD domain-containing protein [Desulfobulbaceae bacterium]
MADSATEQRLAHAREILQRIRIPSQPAVIADLNRLLNEPQPDFKKIAALIGKDAAVAARLFKLINSPLFGRCREVDSIPQALTLLGTENLFKLILTSCLRESLASGPQFTERFWHHTQRVAIAADLIARRLQTVLTLDSVTAGQCYLGGLFHDCAVPILCTNFIDYHELFEMVVSYRHDVLDEEDRTVGTDHCVIGHLMAKSWSLPDHICKGVLLHHDNLSGLRQQPDALKLAAVLQLADYLAHHYDYLAGTTGLVIDTDWDIDEWFGNRDYIGDLLHLEIDEIRYIRDELFELFNSNP